MTMTDERKKKLRFMMWELARRVLLDTSNTRAAMPQLLDEEYEYARTFMRDIAVRTQPGAYRDDYDDNDGELA